MKHNFWIHTIQGVYENTSGALASSAVLDTQNANYNTYRAISVQTDRFKHVLWNPEAAHQTESNLVKFLNRHAGRVDSADNA